MLNKCIRRNLFIHVPSASVLITLLIIGAFYDLKISEALSGVGVLPNVGAALGKLPGFFVVAFSAAVLFKSAAMKEKRLLSRLPLMFLYLLIDIFASFMLGYSILEDISDSTMLTLITALIIGSITLAATLSVANTLTQEKIQRLRKWAFISIITVAVIIIAVMLVKISWGRARYRDVLAGVGAFTPWYVPQGFTGHNSMPSGHTALALCALLFVPMLRALRMPAFVRSAAAAAGIAFTAFIAVSRISGGYHYLSDTAAAVIIAYIIISVSGRIAYGRSGNNFVFGEKSFLNSL